MEPKSNPFNTSDPNSFGSLWLANFGFFGFMGEKPSAREVVEDNSNRLYNQTIQESQSSQTLKCSECCFTTEHQASLDNHLKTAHKPKKMYPCHLCDFSTSNRGNLTYHISKHTGERPFKCDYCDHRARSAAYLKIHVRSRHTGEKPYSCPSCNFATPHSNALKSHIAAKHTGEKKYKCDMCDFSAVHSGNLKYHINAKHSEKPFKCTLCDYSAGHKGNLKTHIETKHTEDKKFKCPECDYSTGHQGNFKHHLRTSHGIDQFNTSDYVPQSFSVPSPSSPPYTSLYPYKCTQCPAYFHYPGKLVSHITEKHNSFMGDMGQSFRHDERFKCNECSFSTDQEHLLVTHKNENHFGIKCMFPTCSYITSRQSDLEIHVRTLHVPPKVTESPSRRLYPPNHYQPPQPQDYSAHPSVCDMNKSHKSIQCPEGLDSINFIYEHNASTDLLKCIPCGFTAPRLEDFQVHLWASHPVEKPSGFKCETCELFALDLGVLKNHMKSNHSSPSRFRCLRCPELFYWSDGPKAPNK